MRPLQRLIPLEDAVRIALDAIRPIDRTETVPLGGALGRVLAVDVVSDLLVPPFARSAMDGYAVIASDTFGASRYKPVRLEIGDVIHAGRLPEQPVLAGRCAQIATGAPLPKGADAVVKVEDTRREGDAVLIASTAHPGLNVAPAGEDIVPGDVVIEADSVLTPSRIGAAAAIGKTELEVAARPRALIFTTGDEIHPIGSALPPGKVYDINSHTLSALLEDGGAQWEHGGNVADDHGSLTAALERARDFDMVMFSGGSSAGERDLIVDVIKAQGEVLFHGIALKPGKPTLFGRVHGTPVFGIPGFPASCLAVAHLIVDPCVRKAGRFPERRRREVMLPLATRITSSVGRHQLFTVRVEDGLVYPAYKESGDITSLSSADGYVEISATTEFLEEGEQVPVVLF